MIDSLSKAREEETPGEWGSQSKYVFSDASRKDLPESILGESIRIVKETKQRPDEQIAVPHLRGRNVASRNHDLTFHPKICSTKAQPKYLDIPRKSPHAVDNPECTFKPSINPLRRSSANKLSPINSSVYERLSRKSSKRISPTIERSTDASKQSEVVNGKLVAENFITRQKMHACIRKQNLEYLSNNRPRDFSPKIDEKSEEIASKMGDFFTRLSRSNSKRKSRDEAKEDPNMLKLRKASPKFKRFGESPKPNKEPDRGQEGEQPRFLPMLNKSKEYERVESKLQLRDNLDTLLLRIKYRKEQKERVRKQEKCMEELEAAMECTHKPKLWQSPGRWRTPRSPNPHLKLAIDKNTDKKKIA